jgi:hypothetical protein
MSNMKKHGCAGTTIAPLIQPTKQCYQEKERLTDERNNKVEYEYSFTDEHDSTEKLDSQQSFYSLALEIDLAQNNVVRYGILRIKQVLERAHSHIRRSLSHRDELLAQPTSISAEVTLPFVNNFLQHLMPDEAHWSKRLEDNTDHTIVDSFRLIWPTATFEEDYLRIFRPKLMRNVIKNKHNRICQKTFSSTPSPSPSPSLSSSFSSLYPQTQTISKNSIWTGRCYCFFHPKDFCAMLIDVQSRFRTYVPNQTSPICAPITTKAGPHNKLYMRLMADDEKDILNDKNLDKDIGGNKIDKMTDNNHVKCTCKELAWCLLTSACMSRGAMGNFVDHYICPECGKFVLGHCKFANFELVSVTRL